MATTTKWPAAFGKEIPQDQLPLAHRTVTIHGLVITFQVLAWFSVGFRVYCRSVIAHALGWDDFFVLCSLGVTTVSTVIIALGPTYGVGQHYLFVNLHSEFLKGWAKVYFFSTLFYFLAAALIKMSILFQYLRLFKSAEARTPRVVCICVMFFTAVWGTLFFFVHLFSCSPMSDVWKTSPGANCILLMSFNLTIWVNWIYAHAVTNMLLDYTVLLLPLLFRRYLEIEARGRNALIALFSIGACVATISAIRLSFLIAYRGGVHPSQDATWHAPAIMIPSALEIQAAVICASVPIFWPVVYKMLRLDQIHITREVIVRSKHRCESPEMQEGRRLSDSSETKFGRPEYEIAHYEHWILTKGDA